jgi:hypothetical protein
MGVSIYYEVTRDRACSEKENALIRSIIKKYNDDPDIVSLVDEGGGELFSFYPDSDEANVILEGAVKLPLSLDSDDVMYVGESWLDLLSEIRNILEDSTWRVHIDGAPVFWNEKEKRFGLAPIADL